NIDVQSDLVAPMAKRKRTAARLGHIANQDSVPAGGFGGQRSEPSQKINQFRMSPIAVSRYTHHLPCLTGDRQFNTSLKTTVGVVANRHCLPETGKFLFKE